MRPLSAPGCTSEDAGAARARSPRLSSPPRGWEEAWGGRARRQHPGCADPAASQSTARIARQVAPHQRRRRLGPQPRPLGPRAKSRVESYWAGGSLWRPVYELEFGGGALQEVPASAHIIPESSGFGCP